MAERKGERIAKIIARAGICSRREAEVLVKEGRVSVNGEKLSTPAVTVLPEDKIQVDGKDLPKAAPARLWRYHKPRGRVTSTRDPEGRPTIYEDLPPGLGRLQPVGRLDINSEGLLLLTNDGGLKRKLELPSTGLTRRYRVRVFGEVDEKKLYDLRDGLEIDGFKFGPIEAEIERRSTSNSWLIMSLQEGKNREIRRICKHLGLHVNRLIRLSYGPLELGDLPIGELRSVPANLVDKLLGRSSGRKKDRGPASANRGKSKTQRLGPQMSGRRSKKSGPEGEAKVETHQGPQSKRPTKGRGRRQSSSGKPRGERGNHAHRRR
ncbi:MAG: pseudouridine synthase [Kiloniellales bacterium]|nr:pseudouridine synthase [Kiloniellales bacterium]